MKFPNFLNIATLSKNRLLEVNGTLVEKKFHAHAEEMLIKVFAEKLGFSYQLVYPDDEQYGTRSKDGNWTGMVGLIQRKEADVIMTRFAITSDRAEAVDYSYPYHISNMVFATRNFEPISDPETFLKPFTFPVWITFAACLFIVPITYNILFEKEHPFRRLIVCRLFGKLPDLSRSETSECVLRISWEVSMLLLRWCYVALVLSFLSFPTLIGVRTIPELAIAIKEGRYKTTASRGSFLPKALIEAGGYSAVIGEDLKKDEGLPGTYYEGALKKTGVAKKIAVVAGEPLLMHLKEKYFISEDVFYHVLIVVGISKDFCCKQQLDDIVNYLWPSGIYQHLLEHGMLYEEYEIMKRSPYDVEYRNNERPLSFEDFKGVFILLAIGYGLAIAVFLCELVYSKYTCS